MTEPVAYEALLRRDGKLILHAAGRSMLPLLLPRRSLVIVEAADRVPPRKGDVVLCRVDGAYILHRLLYVNPEEYVTRGDNSECPEHVPKDALLATMTSFYRKPEGRLVSRNDAVYGMYRAFLPCIRPVRRIGGTIRQTLRKLRRFAVQGRRQGR